jgi:vanillate/3-O-methylgallate O-demethylase
MSANESLEAAVQRVGNPVEFLRNSAYPAHDFPVKPEFTNWRAEQTSWRTTCTLLDQSHHMNNLFISGPDALKLLRDFGVNSFATWGPNRANQYVAVNDRGFMIGDGILFYLDDAQFDFVGNQNVINWLQFQASRGDYKVTLERDNLSSQRVGPPKLYRYEVQGPTARKVIERASGAPLPEVKFFHMTEFKIAGRRARALRHGMAGQPGFEFFGPWEDGDAVLEALLKAGEEFGMVRGGARAYSTANLESGWVPKPPITAIFGTSEKAYREWLPAKAVGSLAGSLDSRNINDFYVTPYDMGLGRVVKFDHDFLGRAALEDVAKNPPRAKVTLVWNVEDVLSVMRSQYEPGTPAKAIEIPKTRYGFFQANKVLHNGRWAGISMDCGYIFNERVSVSLATVEVALATPGTELSLLWGENPNSRKPGVEPHRQVEIRATVAPAPYVSEIRAAYRKS